MSTPVDVRCDVSIRWLITRDMPEVLRIEECFDIPWNNEQFMGVLRKRNGIGMVAEHNRKVVGYMLYRLHKTHLELSRFVVAHQVRRRSVGSQMVQRLLDKLSVQRRTHVDVEVHERNLSVLLFLRSQGFRAVDALHGQYDHYPDDMDYLMRYTVDESGETP